MIGFYRSSKEIMNCAGFPLRERSSNSSTLNVRAASNNECTRDGHTTKLLGLQWDTKHDVLSLGAVIFDVDVSTKREIVNQLAKVYDVIGLCPSNYSSATSDSGSVEIRNRLG